VRDHSKIQGSSAIGTVAYMGGIMSLPEPFVWSWTQMIQFNGETLCEKDEHVHYDRARFSLHDVARNELAERMRGDWLLMLDTDLVFDPDICARLIRFMYAADLDVVTGMYPYKGNPTIPVLSLHDGAGRNSPIVDWDRTLDLIPFTGGGAGCLMVRRRVFERIAAELQERPFDRIMLAGEDFSFFARCRRLSIECWCAWRVQCGHLDYEARMVGEKNLNRELYPFVERETVGIGQPTMKGA
jgi:Glycosyl transferase family 2